jgi:hypothetical protein
MKHFLIIAILIVALAAAGFLFLQKGKTVEISSLPATGLMNVNGDEAPQKPLANPPETVKAAYFTGWSAGNEKKVDYMLKLIEGTELNAAVIDIKDYSGYALYDIQLPDAVKYKSKQLQIPKINSLIKRLHYRGIYAIARIAVFQDPMLSKARPDLAVQSKIKLAANNGQPATSTLWLDNKKLSWIDPGAKEAWGYNVAIAKDALERGFDEVNFDYIRFPSDGNLSDMSFPFDDGQTAKSEIMRNFFRYVRSELPEDKISVDLFGLVTSMTDDMGIGQLLENAYAYFDYVCPMVYPSHFQKGFLGYANPASYPYEVVKYSMEKAVGRLKAYEAKLAGNASSSPAADKKILKTKLRFWLQDFDLGADYDAAMVRKEIQAVYDGVAGAPETNSGWMLWNASNVYTREALNIE